MAVYRIVRIQSRGYQFAAFVRRVVGDGGDASAVPASESVALEDGLPEFAMLGVISTFSGVAAALVAVSALLLFVGVAFAAGGGWFAAAGL